MRFSVKPALLLLAAGALFLGGGCGPTPGERADEQREPHFLQGKNRLQALDYTGAIESFERALEMNSRSSAAHFELGLLNEEYLKDYAVAIYHYQRFLQLRPGAPQEGNTLQRIMTCKQYIAKDVSLGPVSQSMQKDLDRFAEENTLLRQRVTELEESLARSQSAAAAAVATGAPRNDSSPLALNNPVTPRTEPKAAPAAGRTHTIKSGDTLDSIARRYGVSVPALKAANPGVSERALGIGKTLSIPAR
jgi:LysM repeat protein